MMEPFNQSVAWRSPAIGIVPPNSSISVRLQVPIDVNIEAPLILTFNGGVVLQLREVLPNQVTIDNTSTKAVPYVMVIVSRTALALRDLSWRDRLRLVMQKMFPNLPLS